MIKLQIDIWFNLFINASWSVVMFIILKMTDKVGT